MFFFLPYFPYTQTRAQNKRKENNTDNSRHTINLTNGLPSHGAFALYTTLHADKAAHLPSSIPFSAGATIPTAFEAALCALCVHVQMHVINHVAVLGSASSLCGRGIPIPMLSLPYPALNPIPSGKIIFVHGAASSVGAMVVQVATAAGITVFATASERHHAMVRECGAVAVWDYHDKNKFVGEVVAAVRAVISSPKTATPPERKEKEKEKEKGNGNSKEPKFVGIVDAISQEDTYATDLEILGQLGSGWLACTHPPPTKLPENVRAGMIFGVNEVATPMWRGWVTPALEKGRLKCLPRARVVGKGLEFIQTALELYEKGVSGEKLVVEL